MDQLFKNRGIHSLGVEQKKVYLKKQVLKTLYFKGPQSNADLAKSLKLSAPNITGLISGLIEDELVTDLGQGGSSGGRRPNIYGLEADGFYLIGINIGLYRTGISIFNSHNDEIGEREYFPYRISQGFQIFNKINDHLKAKIKNTGIDENRIIAMGIEMPGLVDQKKGMNNTYFPDLENLLSHLQYIFDYPVYFENNAKVRAFAERQFGLAKSRKNVLCLNVGWGIGLGIITNGKLYSGKTGFSGELGHLQIVDNGILCKCGKQGCLETIASLTAMVRMAREGLQSSGSSLLSELVGDDTNNIDPEIIIQAALDGDDLSTLILTNVGHWLGRSIAYLLQIFNPELIIVGGKISRGNNLVMEPIRQAVQTYSNYNISSDTEIRFSELGPKAGIIGAAALALEKVTSAKTLSVEI